MTAMEDKSVHGESCQEEISSQGYGYATVPKMGGVSLNQPTLTFCLNGCALLCEEVL